MREAQFLKQNIDKWKLYEAEIGQQGQGDNLAERFIELTDDLSYSKTFYPKSRTTAYLNGLASQFHIKIYKNKKERTGRIWNFWQYELPFLFRFYHRQFLYALIFFLVFCFIGAVSAKYDETFLRLILSDGYVDMTNENIEKGDPFGVYKSSGQLSMFVSIASNNIRVAFITYVMGGFLSAGAVWMLFSNGLMLGSFEYFFFSRGLGFKSITVIFIHGTLEIWALVVAGAAGLIIGNSILFPGTYSRSVSILKGGKDGLKIVLGLIPVFLAAAFLESFVTRYDHMPLLLSLGILAASLLFITWYFIYYPIQLHKRVKTSLENDLSTSEQKNFTLWAQQKIELRKIRDFGENVNDTFVFIAQNLKPLLIDFVCIAGLFLLANAVFNGLYQSQFANVFRQIIAGRGQYSYSPFDLINGNYFIVLLLTWLSMNAMQVTIISYIKLYELNRGGAPSVSEVWDVFKKYFFKVLFYSIPVYLLIIIGLFFCLVPGIYFAVVFTPFPIVLMVEDSSFGEAFNRCFEIIKSNFWSTFLVYFVVYIIYAIAAGIITAVLGGLTGLLSYLSTNDIVATVRVTTSVLTAFSFVFYIIYYVSVSLQYFTLAEKRDGTGILQRLDRLGESGPDFNNIKEDY